MSDLLKSLYPIMVAQSRYGGVYEGGLWHALPKANAGWMWCESYSEYMFGDDEDAAGFWNSPDSKPVGRGDTPNAAVMDLLDRHNPDVIIDE